MLFHSARFIQVFLNIRFAVQSARQHIGGYTFHTQYDYPGYL